MCGIAGIFNLNGERVSQPILKSMSAALAHRGPDGKGIFCEDNVGLVHRRLSIIDLSENGRQPMSSGDGSWEIVFNGCIYNYQELKNELISRGHRFRSSSDTEVIVEGLSEYGPDFLQRLNGMFAIGAWNTINKTLILSRDRFGVKPLYYWFSGRTLVFASEIKAIIKHPDYKIDINHEALNEYFTFQNLFTYNTLFSGITMLPPANTVKIESSSSGVNHQSWWDYNFSGPDEKMSFNDAKQETERLFVQAVKRQMIADVPVGSYLSGGMDSGSITAIASQNVDRLSTFTAGFDMSSVDGVERQYDERRAAEVMANHFKTEHYEQVLNARDMRWSIAKLVYHLEDLRVGMSYPNYYIARLASKFVKVVLQGTGGDELYGGYPWRYYRVFDAINQEVFFSQYYNFWQRLVSSNDRKNNLFTSNIKDYDPNRPRTVFENVFRFNKKLCYSTPEDHIQNSLYFEIKTFLPGLLLVGDKLAMAHGLEERFPFLDNDLVDFAQQIPVRHKLGNLRNEIEKINENELMNVKQKLSYRSFNDGKNVLRKAMFDFIPREIIERKKQGFSAPDESWYRGENAKYINDLLLSKNTKSIEYINQNFIRDIINKHTNKGQNYRLLIWSLLNFEWWVRLFMDNDAVDKC